MDLQAQDRAHRIGQTKPVLIFRLVSRHTIESKIMQRASEKRQLEALVIAKGVCGALTPPHPPSPPSSLLPLSCTGANIYSPGKFKGPIGGSAKAGEARQTIAEMAAQLLELEGEHIEVVQSSAAGKRGIISDAELDMLLDRRKEVFEGRRVGWKSGASVRSANDARKAGGKGSPGAPAASARRDNADGGLFEVYQAPVDEGNDALAHMLGEDVAT
jgi:ATP-dependent DNA helicase